MWYIKIYRSLKYLPNNTKYVKIDSFFISLKNVILENYIQYNLELTDTLKGAHLIKKLLKADTH